jgi:hypothetical protein
VAVVLRYYEENIVKKSVVALIATLAALSACGPSQSPEQRAEIRENKAKNAAIWKTRDTVAVNGKTYEIAVAPDRTYAFVSPARSDFAYSPVEIEAVARAQTGCKATFGAGILAYLGGYSETADLRPIQAKVSGFNYWRADLSC